MPVIGLSVRSPREGIMRTKLFFSLLVISLSISVLATAQDGSDSAPSQGGDFSSNSLATKVPANVILVKGAVASASDSMTPLPESGSITEHVYNNRYFGMSYPLPPGFSQKYVGPPPSDSGYYVLTQIEPAGEFKAANAGTILISAQDMFFTLTPASNAFELVKFKRTRLSDDFKVERQPTEVKIANHSFVRMDYSSPVAELHWYTLATQIRCHAVEFTLTSRDPELLEALVRGMEKMKLPDDAGPAGRGGGEVPVCVKDYATPANVLHRVDPVFADRKFNPIPVRIIIDKYGKVKHVHLISAFPDQARTITDALLQWEFKPYKLNGQPVVVETGLLFGAKQRPTANQTSSASASE